MSLLVCSSATSTAGVAHSSDLRSLLNTSSTFDDDWHKMLIDMATDWAESYLHRRLRGPEVYRETVAAYGRQSLMVSQTPIRTVFAVFHGTDTGTATELLSSEYIVESCGAGLLRRDQGFAWTGQTALGIGDSWLPYMDRQPYLIEYSAGYVPPQGKTSTADGTTSTGQTLPRTIELAILYKARAIVEDDGMVLSRRAGDLAVQYRGPTAGDETGSAALAVRLLQPHRRLK